MIAFRDRTGRLWTGRLDVGAAIRMRDLAGVDVMELITDQNAADAFGANPSRLADAAFALVLPQCEQRGVDDRAFGDALWWRWWQIWNWRRNRVAPSELATVLFDGIGQFFAIPDLSPGEPKGSPPSDKPTAAMLWGLVWRHAAVSGVDAHHYTFGELVALSDAKRKHDWGQTACLRSTIHNANISKKSDAKTPAYFDPTGGLGAGGEQKLALTRENFVAFTGLLMGGR